MGNFILNILEYHDWRIIFSLTGNNLKKSEHTTLLHANFELIRKKKKTQEIKNKIVRTREREGLKV